MKTSGKIQLTSVDACRVQGIDVSENPVSFTLWRLNSLTKDYVIIELKEVHEYLEGLS